MLTFILAGLAVLVAGFALVVALQPKEFRVTRTATIGAPPETVFAQIDNLHHWNAWSPWARIDPTNSKTTFSGPIEGPSASMAWAGSKKLGEGRMTITGSTPSRQVLMRLEFVKPFVATNDVEFLLEPAGDSTTLTWSMSGQNKFMGKAFSLVMNCDKMCGDQFEQGFANLKEIVEQVPVA